MVWRSEGADAPPRRNRAGAARAFGAARRPAVSEPPAAPAPGPPGAVRGAFSDPGKTPRRDASGPRPRRRRGAPPPPRCRVTSDTTPKHLPSGTRPLQSARRWMALVTPRLRLPGRRGGFRTTRTRRRRGASRRQATYSEA